MKDPKPPLIMTVKEAREYLRLGKALFSRELKAGRIPCRQIGTQYRFNRAALDDFIRYGSPHRHPTGIPATLKEFPT